MFSSRGTFTRIMETQASRQQCCERHLGESLTVQENGGIQTRNQGLTQKNLAKEFDFPIPLSETSKIMKKKNKKVLVWSGVYKVISKMLEENEKYRLRLKCQQLSRESLTYFWICLSKKIMKSLKMEF
uniref:Uncharacterized protein n=1 Tax=Capra hircus TaxID=9925 RepID=A0A8C2S3T9_CAPHI